MLMYAQPTGLFLYKLKNAHPFAFKPLEESIQALLQNVTCSSDPAGPEVQEWVGSGTQRLPWRALHWSGSQGVCLCSSFHFGTINCQVALCSCSAFVSVCLLQLNARLESARKASEGAGLILLRRESSLRTKQVVECSHQS